MNYTSINDHLKNKYGEKVYKLSIDAGMSCPNRDGRLGTGGCIFCSEGGSGDFAFGKKERYSCSAEDIVSQLEQAKELIAGKTDCYKFIAYFQAFTNTYAPVDYLRKVFYAAIEQPDIEILSIATRCDCISDEILELLKELNRELHVTVVVITHEMKVVEAICHRVAILADNKVEELGTVEEIFHRPKSMAARQLIVPSSQVPPKESFGDGRFLRITFDGRERTDQPLVAEMVLHTGAPVSIVFADTRSLNGRLYGQMILQVPEDDAIMEKMLEFLRTAEVSFEEVI